MSCWQSGCVSSQNLATKFVTTGYAQLQMQSSRRFGMSYGFSHLQTGYQLAKLFYYYFCDFSVLALEVPS